MVFSFAPDDYFSLCSCNYKSQYCVARKPDSDRACECNRVERKCNEKYKCRTTKKPCKNQVYTSSLFNFFSIEVLVVCEERSFGKTSTNF